jgi:MFS family permease
MFLINHFSFTLLFMVCFGASLCSLFTTLKLGKRPVPQEDSPIKDGFFLDWKAVPPSIVSFFQLFTWGALATFFPLYAIKNGVANPGLFFTANAVVIILGRILGGRILDRYSREKVILSFLSICILSMIILAFSKTLPMFIFVGVIWGIGIVFLTPAVIVYTLERAGSSRGPAMGTYTAFSDLGLSLGPVVMGIIIPLTSYPIMFLCLAFLGAINFSYFYFFVKKECLF